MTTRLSAVTLSGTGERAPPPEVDQERQVAIFDLLEENHFAPVGAPAGPYRLDLTLQDGKLAFNVTTEGGRPAAAFAISLGELQQIVKDYGRICASYYEAVRSKPPAEIEALDEARRAIHGEGGAGLRARLADHVEVDEETAKRLFTLLHALAAGR